MEMGIHRTESARIGSLLCRLRKDLVKNRELYLFFLPGLVLLITFAYIPLCNGFLLAFKDYKPRLGINASPWLGLYNFKMFLSSYNFLVYFKNTLRLSIYSLFAGFPLPIIFAFMINELKMEKFKKTVQTISYAPHFISVVVIVGMLRLFFSDTGLVNNIIVALGGEEKKWGLRGMEFVHQFVWSGIWQGLGYSSIIYIAALAGVDPQQVDAAIIDGATKIKRIWHIELPTILPTVTILFIFAVGGIVGVDFQKVLLMQTDLNRDYSEVIATYAYRVGIVNSKYSFSAAVGLFNSLIAFILLTLTNYVAKYVGETSLW